MEKIITDGDLMGLLSVFLLVVIPFLAGIILFSGPGSGKPVMFLIYLSSSILAASMLFSGQIFRVSLLGSFGVDLLMDQFAWTFILMNGLVFLGVTLSRKSSSLPVIAFPLMVLLHGTANAVFLSYDLFNIFVCIELATILAFLLIRLGNKPRQVWSAVQYLIVGNVGMILYLLGCIFAYSLNGSFSMETIQELPKLPVYLLVTGLSVKGGVFVMGLWLPEAHGEAESAVSALLSGVIIKIGIAPLLRLAHLSPAASDLISILAASGAILGMTYALFEVDLKKVIAYSSLSQTGFILAVPHAGHLYALAHGLFKAWFFLSAGDLESRDLRVLNKQGISKEKWIPLVLASLALSGLPGLGGLGIKSIMFRDLREWQIPLMNLAALGSCIYVSRFLFLPLTQGGKWRRVFSLSNVFFLVSIMILELFLGSAGWLQLLKPVLMILAGMSLYRLFLHGRYGLLPKWPEELVHIMGLSLLCILGMIGVFGL